MLLGKRPQLLPTATRVRSQAHPFPAVVATINDSETGNDVICGQRTKDGPSKGSRQRSKERRLSSIIGGLSGCNNERFALGNADDLEAQQYQ